MYKILKQNEDSYKIAGKLINDGNVIVVPTDTVYAVICDANNSEALKNLRDIRQSPSDKPLTLIIDKKDISNYCEFKNSEYEKLVDELLPGRVSFFLNKRGEIFEDAVPNSDAICVFWQDNSIKEIYKHCKGVLAISSANTKSLPEATTVEEAINYFGDRVSLYIEGHNNSGSQGTTQLDLRNEKIKLMRNSEIFPLEKIESIIKEKSLNVEFE